MKTRHYILFSICCLFGLFTANDAQADILLNFNRTGTTAQSVNVTLTDENGKTIEGASATMTSSHDLMATKGAVTNQVVCPNVNGKTNPTIKLTFNIKGLPASQKFKVAGFDLHAFNQAGGYQSNTNDAGRKYNLTAKVGKSIAELTEFGTFNDFDVAANVGEGGEVHQIWLMKNDQEFTAEGNYVIELTITTGSVNMGCFIGLSQIVLSPNVDFGKEPVLPFKPSPSVGNAFACYAMMSTAGKALSLSAEGVLSWETPQDKPEQIWYYVEKNGGYLLVNMKGHRIYHLDGETETIWTAADNTAGKGFYLLPQATQDDKATCLTIDGESVFIFESVHNAFSRAAQIYEIPCGALSENYISRLTVGGDVIKPMQYPLAEVQLGEIKVPMAQIPETEYYIYTEDKATAAAGAEITIQMHLNKAPLEGLEGFIYFDWNRDGMFETSQPITLAQVSTIKATLPQDAKAGKTRVRIRLTDNGLHGADNEVVGQIFDWILNVESAAPESFNLNVQANDSTRGTVTASETAGWNLPCTVTATPKGNATFVCWREGLQILSLDKEYQFNLNHETNLVAYFSPKTSNVPTGIEENLKESSQLIEISAENQMIKVVTDAKIKKVLVFLPNGQLVAQSTNETIQLSGAATGTYIVKVYTETADETAKILIR